MTDRHGRRARWTAVLLVAPAAAGIFGAATSWATHASPVTAAAAPTATTVVTASAPLPAPDPDLTALRATVTADRRQLSEIQSRLGHLRRQLKGLGAPVTVTPALPAIPAGSGSASRAGTGTGAPAKVPHVVAAPAPAPPPPPAQAKTGASGTRK